MNLKNILKIAAIVGALALAWFYFGNSTLSMKEIQVMRPPERGVEEPTRAPAGSPSRPGLPAGTPGIKPKEPEKQF